MNHPTALVETAHIGAGTRVWAFAHVMAGAQVGAGCNIGDHAFIESGAVLGDGVTIKNGVCVWEGVTLGHGVFVGPNAVFTNDRRPRSPRLEAVRARYATKAWLEPTMVREGVTIGANATIVCGITLGEYAFIAAGALVTKTVRPYALMLGAPARQNGWVCRCGARLQRSATGWDCGECDGRYLEGGDTQISPA